MNFLGLGGGVEVVLELDDTETRRKIEVKIDKNQRVIYYYCYYYEFLKEFCLIFLVILIYLSILFFVLFFKKI